MLARRERFAQGEGAAVEREGLPASPTISLPERSVIGQRQIAGSTVTRMAQVAKPFCRRCHRGAVRAHRREHGPARIFGQNSVAGDANADDLVGQSRHAQQHAAMPRFNAVCASIDAVGLRRGGNRSQHDHGERTDPWHAHSVGPRSFEIGAVRGPRQALAKAAGHSGNCEVPNCATPKMPGPSLPRFRSPSRLRVPIRDGGWGHFCRFPNTLRSASPESDKHGY